jgi:hypothetical protein
VDLGIAAGACLPITKTDDISLLSDKMMSRINHLVLDRISMCGFDQPLGRGQRELKTMASNQDHPARLEQGKGY